MSRETDRWTMTKKQAAALRALHRQTGSPVRWPKRRPTRAWASAEIKRQQALLTPQQRQRAANRKAKRVQTTRHAVGCAALAGGGRACDCEAAENKSDLSG